MLDRVGCRVMLWDCYFKVLWSLNYNKRCFYAEFCLSLSNLSQDKKCVTSDESEISSFKFKIFIYI